MTIPGEVLFGNGDIEINPGRATVSMTVRNTGDRPVQVGSHFHFAESNEALAFDRKAAWGYRLAVPAGTSVRFEPGIPRDITLVALGGARIVPGLRGLAGGPLDSSSHVHENAAPGSPGREDAAPGSSGREDDVLQETAPENGSPR